MSRLISIIIPTLNSETHLRECFDSIIKQTYKKIEVIIIDGGSSDRTQIIANEYCDNNLFWKLITTTKGVSHQRNVGLDVCKGSFVFFLDSDDYISPNLISDLYAKMLADELDLITPSICSITYDNNKIIAKYTHNDLVLPIINKHNYFEGGYDSYIPSPVKLYKKSIIMDVRFIEDLSYGEDLLFNYEIAKKHDIKFGICKTAIYYYRHNILQTNPMEKRMNRNGYCFCNMMTNILKKLDKTDNNYRGALSILKESLKCYIDIYIKHKKIIPPSLIKPRVYMFFHTNTKLKYYFLFPYLYKIIKKLSK